MVRQAGWPALFWTAFRSSRNAMALLDDQRHQIDVNAAYLELTGRRRSEVLGHPIYELVADGPVMSAAEWRMAIAKEEFTGVADLVRPDGRRLSVQFAGHPETVTGKRMILFVALDAVRSGRRTHEDDPARPAEPLSRREQEVVSLIGQGSTGPEIAEELRISHNTVRTHAFNAMTKLNARSRAHLVAKAFASGALN